MTADERISKRNPLALKAKISKKFIFGLVSAAQLFWSAGLLWGLSIEHCARAMARIENLGPQTWPTEEEIRLAYQAKLADYIRENSSKHPSIADDFDKMLEAADAFFNARREKRPSFSRVADLRHDFIIKLQALPTPLPGMDTVYAKTFVGTEYNISAYTVFKPDIDYGTLLNARTSPETYGYYFLSRVSRHPDFYDVESQPRGTLPGDFHWRLKE